MTTWCKSVARALGRAGAVLLLSGTLSCGLNSSVSFVLQFPSEGAFLSSSAATVSVYDAEENIEICRQLSAGEDPGSDALADLPATDVCEYQNGDLTLGGLSQGVRAIFVEVTGSEDETVILRGCRVFNLGFERDPVQVDLAATPEFNTNAVDSDFSTAQERCGR